MQPQDYTVVVKIERKGKKVIFSKGHPMGGAVDWDSKREGQHKGPIRAHV